MFMIMYCPVLLQMRLISQNLYRKTKHVFYIQYLKKFVRFKRLWKSMVQPDRQQITI